MGWMVWLVGVLTPQALAVPVALSTQGRILDADGQPLEGPVQVAFRIMDAEADGEVRGPMISPSTWTTGSTRPVWETRMGPRPSGRTCSISRRSGRTAVGWGGALTPRLSLDSVHARLAERRKRSPEARSMPPMSVGGLEVIDSSGRWVGPTPEVGWSDLLDIPPTSRTAWMRTLLDLPAATGNGRCSMAPGAAGSQTASATPL